MKGVTIRALDITARYWYWRAERWRAAGFLAAAHRYFARAARAGYAPAQHMVARAYQTGQGCVRSGAIAEHWYRVAAESGHADSQFELGLIVLDAHDINWAAGSSAAWLSRRGEHDDGLTKTLFASAAATSGDPQQAFNWLLKAAEAGKPEAQANVGWLLLKGKGCVADRHEAFRWLTAASSHNLGQAALGIAEFYSTEDTSDDNRRLAADWAKRASQLGNGSGSRLYGLALRDGNGISRDTFEAERYLKLAAEQGHRTAGYDAAVLTLARGPSVEDVQSITERLRLCAKHNHLPSALLLADIYGRGDQLRPDLREVAHWLQVAADLGDTQAQFQMGCLYARGDGVVRDLKHAARYFELAAEGGHAQAAFNFGVFQLTGQGGEQDVKGAKRWLARAADAGVIQAQFRLGQILEREASTPIEAASARTLIEQAANAGSREAKLSLARLLLSSGNMSSEQRAITLLQEAMEAGDVEACELLLNRTSGLELDKVILNLQRMVHHGDPRAKIIMAEALLTNEKLPKDAPRALALLKESAATGDAQAYFLIGVIYCQGNIIEKDLNKGYENYRAAADRGHFLAQYNAGIMLLQGLGVEKSAENAIALIRQAAVNNLQKAVDFIRDLEQRA